MNSIEVILIRMFTLMDSVKPQRPELYAHLMAVMKYQGQFYAEDTLIYHVGQEVDRAFFISEGFITRSSQIKGAKKQLLSIFEQDEIKAGPDFMEQTPSEFLIEATGGTFVAYITYAQLEKVYELFPEAHELASLIISRHIRKEARIRKILSVKGIALVKAFYLRYPKMTEPGSVLYDEVIATFLRISVSLLREHRAELFRSKQLLNPADKKNISTLNTSSSGGIKKFLSLFLALQGMLITMGSDVSSWALPEFYIRSI